MLSVDHETKPLNWSYAFNQFLRLHTGNEIPFEMVQNDGRSDKLTLTDPPTCK